jgi:hypothetical protein
VPASVLWGDPPGGILAIPGRRVRQRRDATRAPDQRPEMAGQLGLPRWASDGPEMLFPTKLRVKISSRLSYPVGAELISSELADVPQAQSLEVRFHGKYERMETRGQPYSIFTVSYAGTQSYQPGWSIEVRPVPRALKHTVKETLSSEFFPRIRKWLEDRADLDSRHGFDALSVVLDENGETLLKLNEWHTPDARSN